MTVATDGRTIIKTVPRVRTRNPLSSTLAFQQDPVQFLSTLVSEYGDIARFDLLGIPLVVINHPDHIKRVLLDNYANYDRDVLLYRIVRPVLRNGLLTNIGGESWLHQRRLIQPAFHRHYIATLGTLMTDLVLDMAQDWEKKAEQDQPLNVAQEMEHLTMRVIFTSLFSTDIGEKEDILEHSMNVARDALGAFARFPFPPLSVPTPSHLRLRSAIKTMNKVITDLIQQRIQKKGDTRDILSMLLQTIDEESGKGMDLQQLRDEIINLIVGAYETTSSALAFAWYLLSQHPDVEQRLHEELDTVLKGRTPTVDDLPNLPYMRMVVDETLRIYPAGWQAMRRARANDEINGYAIPANTIVFWSLYTMHRHPAFWENPEQFDPERFSPENVAKRPRSAYMPFGYGPRLCIGNYLALAEMQLTLATIAQRYRLVIAPGYQMKPVAVVTLHPKGGLPMYVERR